VPQCPVCSRRWLSSVHARGESGEAEGHDPAGGAAPGAADRGAARGGVDPPLRSAVSPGATARARRRGREPGVARVRERSNECRPRTDGTPLHARVCLGGATRHRRSCTLACVDRRARRGSARLRPRGAALLVARVRTRRGALARAGRTVRARSNRRGDVVRRLPGPWLPPRARGLRARGGVSRDARPPLRPRAPGACAPPRVAGRQHGAGRDLPRRRGARAAALPRGCPAVRRPGGSVTLAPATEGARCRRT